MSTHDEQPQQPGARSSEPYTVTPASAGASAADAPPEQAPGPEPKRSRRGLRIVVWVVGALVVLVGLLVVADVVLRQVVQTQVKEQIQKQLPSDVTAKDLTVKVHGFSVIAQYLAGRFDQVDLDADHVSVDGNPLSARVVAYGVPTDFSKPVHRIDGHMVIGEDSVNALVDLPNDTSVSFARDTVGLTGTGQILGIDVGYKASVAPTIKNGDTIVLTPRSVSVTAGSGSLDVTRFAQNLLPSSIPICVAQYLPDGVDATGLTIRKGEASVSVGASDFVLDDKSLQSRGSCD